MINTIKTKIPTACSIIKKSKLTNTCILTKQRVTIVVNVSAVFQVRDRNKEEANNIEESYILIGLILDYRSVNTCARRAVQTYIMKTCFIMQSTDFLRCCYRHHEIYSTLGSLSFLGTTPVYGQHHVTIQWYRNFRLYFRTSILSPSIGLCVEAVFI